MEILLRDQATLDFVSNSHECMFQYYFLSPSPHEKTLSHPSMASFSSSSSSSHDPESIRVLVNMINHHIHEFIANSKTRKSLKEKCTAKIKIQKQDFFEFSAHSVLSNLYWGIESVEAAILAKSPEEKVSRLKNSEKMLQVPAMLSLVWKLQMDEWQVVLHFLQALLVSPMLVQTEFVPKLCECLLLPNIISESSRKMSRRMEFDEDEVTKSMRDMARRYKAWLTYYQVMSYGEPRQLHCGNKDFASSVHESQQFKNKESTNINEGENSLGSFNNQMQPLDYQESITDDMGEESKSSTEITEFQECREARSNLDECSSGNTKTSSTVKCLQDMLLESQSDTPMSRDSYDGDEEEGDFEEYGQNVESSTKIIRLNAEINEQQKQQATGSTMAGERATSSLQASTRLTHEEFNEGSITKFCSNRFSNSFSNLDLSILDFRDMNVHTVSDCHIEGTTQRRQKLHDFQYSNNTGTITMQNYPFANIDRQRSSGRRKQLSSIQKNLYEGCLHLEHDSLIESMGLLDKAISKLCFSEGLKNCSKEYIVEIPELFEMLNKKVGVKYALLKDIILDQLLTAISSAKEEGIIRASVSILSTIISGQKSVVEDIKKKGLQLCDLANALKRNVHEAAILIYLINPSPTEIKTLELLPTLVEVVCNAKSYKSELASILLTPPAASLMIIEVLVTAFDYTTNNMHLARISSPQVISGLLEAPRKNDNLDEVVSLATILVKCMRFDGQCRKSISQITSMASFICLLQSKQRHAKYIGLEFLHEILCVPRASAIGFLEQIQKEGNIKIMETLGLLIHQAQHEYKLLAANLLLQLAILEDSSDTSIFREEALEVLTEAVTCEENSAAQQLSASILSNIGGTYDWTGQPYTAAWLVKKAGITTLNHRNIIKNFEWFDQCLQDDGTDKWQSKCARHLIKLGSPIFHALEKGLKSKNKRVSLDCLKAIAWIGCEIVTSPENLRHSACEIILNSVEQFLHPGLELEERLLACLCIYNYASGKGMQKLIHSTEGVLESLRRLSSVTWMAEELLKVANYFLPNKWRISCVHTQILEVGNKCCGAVNALIYYKGQLYSGYGDGSIKVWDIKGQTATLVLDIKEHKKAVTCFSLFEPGNLLLSGSADKTIKIWKMVGGKLECIEVIATKEPVHSLDTYGQLIFAITKTHEMKVFDESRIARDVCKRKRVKCAMVYQGKVYIGCKDASVQELTTINNQEREIKAPSKSWSMRSKSINSIVMHKDWMYSAGTHIDGSSIKDWRRHIKPQMAIVPGKGEKVMSMAVVEDFVYLSCSSSMSILQIWLRGTQNKVGRLSAGSNITSLLTANDIVLCGTETGLIKGWIPL